MRRLDHQNVVQLLYFFFISSSDRVRITHLFIYEVDDSVVYFLFLCPCFFKFGREEVYLHLVLEFIPETVNKVARHYAKSKQTIPMFYIKVNKSKIIIEKNSKSFKKLKNS